MKTPILETERLILRPITMDDAPAVQELFNNWNIIQHLGLQVPWPYPDDGAQQFIKTLLPKMELGKQFIWAITLRPNQNLIGVIDFGINRHERDNRGFWLGEPFWGYGYMTEAVAVVNDFVFDELGINEFYAMNYEGNMASRRVKEKTGAEFVEYAECKHHIGISKSERWRVTKESWLKAKSS